MLSSKIPVLLTLYCQKYLLICLYTHMNLSDIPFLIHRVYDIGPPFAAITASTLLGKLSTKFRSVFMGIFDHSSSSAFVRSDTDVGPEGLAHSLHSNSSQRSSIGLGSGLCAGLSSSSTPNLLIHVFMDLALCTCVILEQEGVIPKLFPQSWEHEIVQNLLVC